MPLFTKQQLAHLLKNGEDHGDDHVPVVKLFTPDSSLTWLISEVYPQDRDIAFGLCDLGQGHPELGDIYLPEIETLRGHLGLPVERDKGFEGAHPISVYAKAARHASKIVEDIEPSQGFQEGKERDGARAVFEQFARLEPADSTESQAEPEQEPER